MASTSLSNRTAVLSLCAPGKMVLTCFTQPRALQCMLMPTVRHLFMDKEGYLLSLLSISIKLSNPTPEIPPTYILVLLQELSQELGEEVDQHGFRIWKLVSREEYGSPVAKRRRAAPILRHSGHTFVSWAPCLPGGISGNTLVK